MARTDYNDLGDSFQKIFKKVADKKLNRYNIHTLSVKK